jgi:uncharacterized Zn finger protein
LALRAAEEVVLAAPDLPGWATVERLSGDGWPERREELLRSLASRRDADPHGSVDIFLREERIDLAIGAVSQRWVGHELKGRVADAAIERQPDWVIAVSRAEADQIMDNGQARYYDSAARWLARARAAYAASGKSDEWQAYHARIVEKHGRKYKLMAYVRQLG